MLQNKSQESREPPTQPPGAEEGANCVITIVFVALLIDLLGFTLILPLLPSILDHFSQNGDPFYMTLQRGVDWFSEVVGVPPERKYNSVLFGGLIGSIFSILQFFASPLTGAASDYFGRRPVMLLTLVGLIASYFLWAISRSFELFLFSRIIGGISKGNVSLSTAIIADLQSPKARSKGMAMIGVAFSLGFTFGPMLGAYLAMEAGKGELFYVRSAMFAVLFAMADLAFVFVLLPETLPKEKRAIMLLAPAFLLIGWSANVIILTTGLFFYSFASAVVVPCLSTVVSSYGLASQKGTLMGTLRSLGALARAVGPIMSATVYWLAGAEVCFTVCAFLFLLPFMLLRSIPRVQMKDK